MSLALLASALSLPSIQSTHQTITTFRCTYVLPFLSQHPHPQTLLDPDYAQIKLRLSLLSQHPSLDWTGPAQGHEAEAADRQTAQAARFVYAVIEGLAAAEAGNRDRLTEMLRDEGALREAHQVLCRLQSIWIGNGEWEAEDDDDDDGKEGEQRDKVRQALGSVLRELEGK